MAIPRNLSFLAQGASASGVLSVAYGGTGATTLTANNVILGNGTSAPNFVAPGTSGNVLTSNGTTWTSAAPSGGVTSLAAGNGITVSGSTGAVTVSQDFYTGTSSTNTSFPIGSYVWVSTLDTNNNNSTRTIYLGSSTNARSYITDAVFSALTGTWRSRGGSQTTTGSDYYQYIYQRTA